MYLSGNQSARQNETDVQWLACNSCAVSVGIPGSKIPSSPTFCVDCNGVHSRGDGCPTLVALCSLTPLYFVANPSSRGYEKRSIAHDLVMRPSFRDAYIPQKLFFYGSPPELKVRGLVVAGQCFISACRTMLNLSLLDSAHRCLANRGARGPRYDKRGHEPTTNLGAQNSPKCGLETSRIVSAQVH